MIPFPYQLAGAGLTSIAPSTPPAPGDPHWDNVSALLHFDGVNGATSFGDETGRTWARAGTVQLSTAQARFGPSSALFGATGGQILRTPTDAGMLFGTGDFTIEAFVRPSGYGNYPNIFSNRGGSGGSGGITLRINPSGRLNAFYGAGSGDFTDSGAGAISTSSWTHVALVREGRYMRLFRGGLLAGTRDLGAGSNVDVTNGASDQTFLGAYGGWSTEGATETFRGYMDEVRITKGFARYSSSFEPPQAPFPGG